jgi:hypothetical protein
MLRAASLSVSSVAFLVSLTLFAACGSDDSSSSGPPDGAAGSGGDDGASGGNASTGGKGSTGGDASSGGSPGTGGNAGGTGGSLGEGGMAGSGSGGTGGAPSEVIGAYVDCQNGSDDNSGTEASPLKTLAKAATVATSGTTIVVADGTCDETTEPAFDDASGSVDIPDGVHIRAENTGSVTFHGINGYRSAGIKFLGSGSITGIHFEQFGRAISASTGVITVTSTSFDDIYQGAPIELSGTAQATLSPGGVANYIGDNQRTFAILSDTAKLTVDGGTIEGALDSGISGGALFMVNGDSELVLDGVSLIDNKHGGVAVVGTAKATIKNGSSIKNTSANACCNQAPVRVGVNGELEIIDSTIEGSPTVGIRFTEGTPKLLLDGATITGSASYALFAQVYSDAYPTITITDTTISNNANGFYFNYDTTLEIRDSFIRDNGASSGRGLYLNPAAVHHVFIRGTEFSGHGAEALTANGTTGSTFDLGRGNDLGGNDFSGNGLAAGYANVSLTLAANMTVYAAGNTWDAGAQGAAPLGSADPLPGHYAVSSGDVLDVSGAQQTSLNYDILGGNAGTSTLRLAEKACAVTSTCP